MRSLFIIISIVAALSVTQFARASTLTSTPDRTVIGEDETLQLTVRIDEQIGFGGPDFSNLEDNFEILNQHRSNQFRSINGRTEGWTEWTLILAPKRTGKLLIPSFNFEGEISDAIEITVNSASAAPPGEAKEIFSEMEVDKDSVYVQEQLLVTYRIFASVQVREIRLAEAFEVENANVEVVSETNFRKTIKGVPYRAYEVIYAVHPQKSGEITIPTQTWNLVTAGSPATWFNDPFRSSRGQVKRLRTESRTINVNPSPANYSGVDWLPSADVTLEQHWSSSPNRFVVGEPITRTLTLTAKGMAAAQLPAIPQIASDKVKVYSDQPQFDETKSREGLTGVRIETSAIVPTEPGDFNLPPVRVTWWDTVNKREQVTELPAQLITVAPAAIGNLPQPNTGENTPAPLATDVVENSADLAPFSWRNWQSYWPLLASNLVFAVLSIGFFIAWLSARQQRWEAEPESDATSINLTLNELTRQLRLACADNQAAQAKQAFGKWGKVFYNLNHFAGLQDVIRHSNNKQLQAELRNLDSLLYSAKAGSNKDGSNWDGSALWQCISTEIKQRKQNADKTHRNNGQLKPLYPTAA